MLFLILLKCQFSSFQMSFQSAQMSFTGLFALPCIPMTISYGCQNVQWDHLNVKKIACNARTIFGQVQMRYVNNSQMLIIWEP